MRKKITYFFIGTAAVVLGLTALAKIFSALGHARLLAVQDPILSVGFGNLMVLVGLAELAVAFLCCSRWLSPQVKLALVAWLATNFLVYRIGLWWVGWKRPCSCLGTLTDALHIPAAAADTAMKAVLAFLLVGSYALLGWYRRGRADDERSRARPVPCASP
jgi:hypothetical protein